MDDSTRLTDATSENNRDKHLQYTSIVDGRGLCKGGKGSKGKRRTEFVDDECSTDSGCSSGGSTGSAERLSRRGSGERLCNNTRGRSSRSHCYLDRVHGRGQERLSNAQRNAERSRDKSSRSWSPGDTRTSCSHSAGDSPLHSQSHSPSPSDAHSSSDSDSSKRNSTAATLRKAFLSLKLSSKWETKEKKHTKKSPKRILRSPVSYTYVKGLSGLPTQRVPRNSAQHLIMPCSWQDSVSFYR
ncbi:vitellogenin-1-like [Prorops nasuta]|uniref:vitellogenin-1-like n=1 Tax=Prorops nasuta TaxID=863751 RepID=UPI0034CE576F